MQVVYELKSAARRGQGDRAARMGTNAGKRSDLNSTPCAPACQHIPTLDNLVSQMAAAFASGHYAAANLLLKQWRAIRERQEVHHDNPATN